MSSYLVFTHVQAFFSFDIELDVGCFRDALEAVSVKPSMFADGCWFGLMGWNN